MFKLDKYNKYFINNGNYNLVSNCGLTASNLNLGESSVLLTVLNTFGLKDKTCKLLKHL